MSLFTAQINNWSDWSKVFQSIPAFTPLVEYILSNEHFPPAKIESLTPGTNAVFKVGKYVIKIFAPADSGMDQTVSLQSELFAAKRADALGILTPKPVAAGFVEDKYRFAYIITEYISGVPFTDAVQTMTPDEKTDFGRNLRVITNKLNTPCEPFNPIDVINDKDRWKRWDKYPERFKSERIAYIQSHDFGQKVFVHGDLSGDNILLTSHGGLCILDFGDAVLAPIVYEQELIAIDIFTFDPALLYGFFGNYQVDELADLCFNGLLIHDFGGDTVEEHIGKPGKFQCLEDLRKKLKEKFEHKGDLT